MSYICSERDTLLLHFVLELASLSQAQGGEHYIKKFDAWHHLVVMLYAVMMRLDSLREIKASLFANVNRFNHLGLKHFPCRSTLSDANKRRDSEIFGSIYMNLYEKYRHELYSDSLRKILQMTYHSNRITLFSDIDKDRLSDFVGSVFLYKPNQS